MIDLLRDCGGPGLLMLTDEQMDAAAAFVIVAMLECGKRSQDSGEIEFKEWS